MNIFITNEQFINTKIIDVFEHFIWVERFNTCGDFELCLPISEYSPSFFESIYGFSLITKSDSDYLMFIENIKIESDVEKGTQVILSGRSLESILDRRIIWTRTIIDNMNVFLAVEKLLNENAIRPTDILRTINGLSYKYPNNFNEFSGDDKYNLNIEFTGDNLYEVTCKLCEMYGLGFKISRDLIFSLYKGVDRSYGQNKNPYIVFSPKFDNLINSNFFKSIKDLKNITLIAGEGEEPSRKTTTVTGNTRINNVDVNPPHGFIRRELYTDARDISSDTEDGGHLSENEYLDKLKTRGIEKLSEKKLQIAFEGKIENSNLYEYGVDYFLGDIVQIEDAYGNSGRALVSEMVYSQNNEGISVYPTFKNI